jgi:hypothetical protein
MLNIQMLVLVLVLLAGAFFLAEVDAQWGWGNYLGQKFIWTIFGNLGGGPWGGGGRGWGGGWGNRGWGGGWGNRGWGGKDLIINLFIKNIFLQVVGVIAAGEADMVGDVKSLKIWHMATDLKWILAGNVMMDYLHFDHSYINISSFLFPFPNKLNFSKNFYTYFNNEENKQLLLWIFIFIFSNLMQLRNIFGQG